MCKYQQMPSAFNRSEVFRQMACESRACIFCHLSRPGQLSCQTAYLSVCILFRCCYVNTQPTAPLPHPHEVKSVHPAAFWIHLPSVSLSAQVLATALPSK